LPLFLFLRLHSGNYQSLFSLLSWNSPSHPALGGGVVGSINGEKVREVFVFPPLSDMSVFFLGQTVAGTTIVFPPPQLVPFTFSLAVGGFERSLVIPKGGHVLQGNTLTIPPL